MNGVLKATLPKPNSKVYELELLTNLKKYVFRGDEVGTEVLRVLVFQHLEDLSNH